MIEKNVDRKYKKGEVLMFTTGHYSDYYVDAIMVVKKKFTIRETATAFRRSGKVPRSQWERAEQYCCFLMNHGYIDDIGHDEIHSDVITSFTMEPADGE